VSDADCTPSHEPRSVAASSLDYFILVLFAFVVLDLVFSVLSQEIGWEERLQNDLFCVKWDVNLNSVSQSWLQESGVQVRSNGGSVGLMR